MKIYPPYLYVYIHVYIAKVCGKIISLLAVPTMCWPLFMRSLHCVSSGEKKTNRRYPINNQTLLQMATSRCWRIASGNYQKKKETLLVVKERRLDFTIYRWWLTIDWHGDRRLNGIVAEIRVAFIYCWRKGDTNVECCDANGELLQSRARFPRLWICKVFRIAATSPLHLIL